MELLQNLSDDQIALIGCAGTLMAAGTIMYLSFFVGQWRGRPQVSENLQTQPVPGDARVSVRMTNSNVSSSHRKAA